MLLNRYRFGSGNSIYLSFIHIYTEHNMLSPKCVAPLPVLKCMKMKHLHFQINNFFPQSSIPIQTYRHLIENNPEFDISWKQNNLNVAKKLCMRWGTCEESVLVKDKNSQTRSASRETRPERKQQWPNNLPGNVEDRKKKETWVVTATNSQQTFQSKKTVG